MFGIPPADEGSTAWEEVTSTLPDEEPIACWIWNEAGSLNPDGNPSEQWYADVELQKSMSKLKQAMVKLAEETESPATTMLLQGIGWELLRQPGFMTIESVDQEQISFTGSLVVSLQDDGTAIQSVLEEYEKQGQVTRFDSGKGKFFSVPNAPLPMVIGVNSGFLFAAFGEGQWEAVVARLEKKRAPDWLETHLEKIPIARRSQFLLGNIDAILQSLPASTKDDPGFQQYCKTVSLDSVRSIAVSSGTDSISHLSIVHLDCDKKGLGAVMDVPPISEQQLSELPSRAVAAVALRLSPETILSLFRQVMSKEDFESPFKVFKENLRVDLQADILDHLEGTLRYYNDGTFILARHVGMVRIKDEIKFAASLDRINAAIERVADQNGFEFKDSRKNDLRVFGIANSPVEVYWAVHDGELYISSNSRAIGSHIRRNAKGSRNSLLDGELAAKILTEAKSMGLEGPIAVQHYDIDSVIEVVVPLIEVGMGFLPPQFQINFEFGVEDIPPMESLLGLRAPQSMLFKSSDGYTGVSRYDTPVPLEVSAGVAVGMLLPAIQQVREAARRTQSMNNLRQLALALHNYESRNGSLPPAYTVDADGKPLLSWRVAILPYLEQQELYNRFHLDEPWDSPHNIELLELMPIAFQNPSAISKPGHSDYVAPVGNDSILTPEEGFTFEDITDGMSNTIMLMEIGMSDQVPWSAPQDIDLESIATLAFDNGHPTVVLVAFADGSVRNIDKTDSVVDFKAACRKSDGEGFGGLIK